MLGKISLGVRNLSESRIGILPGREKVRVLLRGSLGVARLLATQGNTVEHKPGSRPLQQRLFISGPSIRPIPGSHHRRPFRLADRPNVIRRLMITQCFLFLRCLREQAFPLLGISLGCQERGP
jgi:hypothetical protein